MNDREFPEYQKQNHRKINWSQKAPVHGLDTETYMGKAILISDENSYIEPKSIDEVLAFLTRHRYEGANNFFFNIRFDFAAMMKWLTDDLFTELIYYGELEYDKWKIRYLPQKLLSIKKQKKTFEFYNLTNFYHGSLKANMKERLSIEKFGNVDANLINSSYGYYDRNRIEIIRYCQRDCEGAKQLGEILQESYYKSVGIYPKKYISTANVTGHLYKTKTFIPSLNLIMKHTPEVVDYYWKAYMGGRFEVLRKGYFDGPVYDYDLKSAYPGTIANLININQGEWKRVDQVNQDAYYGVYKVYVGVGKAHLAPFGYRVENRLTYPQQYDHQINYLTKSEISGYGNDSKIKVVDGWEFYPDRIIRPFSGIVEDIFSRKEEIKRDFGKDSSEYDVIKKCLNTYYGLNVNVNEGVAGRFFNPIYGAEITQDCRCEVYKQGKAAGASLIAIETDGIWTDKKIPGIRMGNKLGSWDVDEYPWLYLTGSGQLASEGVLRTRGTPRRRVGNLVNLAMKHPNEKSITFTRKRPVGMKESLILTRMQIKDINVWHTFHTSIGCNGDRGRQWSRWDFTFGELRDNNFISEPWSNE